LTEHEWIHLTAEQLSADAALVSAIERFMAPTGRAGDAAREWLKEQAPKEASHIATYVLMMGGEVAAFYASLTKRKDADGLLRSRLWLPLFA